MSKNIIPAAILPQALLITIPLPQQQVGSEDNNSSNCSDLLQRINLFLPQIHAANKGK
jgi:hypothetical protein